MAFCPFGSIFTRITELTDLSKLVDKLVACFLQSCNIFAKESNGAQFRPIKNQNSLDTTCLINSINQDHSCLEPNTIIWPYNFPTAGMLLTASSIGGTSEAKDFAITNVVRNYLVANQYM